MSFQLDGPRRAARGRKDTGKAGTLAAQVPAAGHKLGERTDLWEQQGVLRYASSKDRTSKLLPTVHLYDATHCGIMNENATARIRCSLKWWWRVASERFSNRTETTGSATTAPAAALSPPPNGEFLPAHDMVPTPASRSASHGSGHGTGDGVPASGIAGPGANPPSINFGNQRTR